MTKYFFFILLTCLTLLSGWLLWLNQDNSPQLDSEERSITSYMLEAFVTEMDDNGQPKIQLISPKLVNYSNEQLTNLTEPHFIVYNEDKAPWDITADTGDYNSSQEKLTLIDNVKIHQPGSANNTDLQILTSKMYYYNALNIAETDKPVTIIEPSTQINAIGMRALLNEDIIELLSNVRGQHARTN